jgi:hypothetical protein
MRRPNLILVKSSVCAAVLIACRESEAPEVPDVREARDIVQVEPVVQPQNTLAELEAHRVKLEAAAERADVRFGRAPRSKGADALRPSERLLGPRVKPDAQAP